jgi:hypothetical protein
MKLSAWMGRVLASGRTQSPEVAEAPQKQANAVHVQISREAEHESQKILLRLFREETSAGEALEALKGLAALHELKLESTSCRVTWEWLRWSMDWLSDCEASLAGSQTEVLLLREENKINDCELKTVAELSRSQQAEIDHMRSQQESSAELLDHIISQFEEVEAERKVSLSKPGDVWVLDVWFESCHSKRCLLVILRFSSVFDLIL